ncbi:spiralin lipoprotein [Spiroplasma endosymbiont of Polydrusus pterygomalis]|uniref:spiralin lipoprotein n=1 Tax=Spiroplasma endosymbiont of Polydrusus pterygomalis TaxID=3139327 RepID=UPI003CCA946F
MKKLLAFLGAFGMSSFATTPLVACNKIESNNLSRIKTIAAPASVTASNKKQVTVEEVKAALKDNVLKAVQGVVKTTTSTNFVFDVYKDNKGTKYEPVNLKTTAQPVFVQITSAKDKTVVIGKSGYIKVILPKEMVQVTKADIKDVTVAVQEVKIKFKKPDSVTKPELDDAVNTNETLVKAILNALKKKVTGVTDDEYTITNDGTEGDYTAAKNINVTVKTKESSANITGKFTFTVKVIPSA